jgi:hypothetical protein
MDHLILTTLGEFVITEELYMWLIKAITAFAGIS